MVEARRRPIAVDRRPRRRDHHGTHRDAAQQDHGTADPGRCISVSGRQGCGSCCGGPAQTDSPECQGHFGEREPWRCAADQLIGPAGHDDPGEPEAGQRYQPTAHRRPQPASAADQERHRRSHQQAPAERKIAERAGLEPQQLPQRRRCRRGESAERDIEIGAQRTELEQPGQMRRHRERHSRSDPQQSCDRCTERLAVRRTAHQLDNGEGHSRGDRQHHHERLERRCNSQQQGERRHPGCGATPRAVAWTLSARRVHQAAGEQHDRRCSSVCQQYVPATGRQRVVRQRAHGVQNESDQPAIAARPVSTGSSGAQPPHADGTREHQAPDGKVPQQSDGTKQHRAAEAQQAHRGWADAAGTNPYITPAIQIRPEHRAGIGEMCELAVRADAAREQVA